MVKSMTGYGAGTAGGDGAADKGTAAIAKGDGGAVAGEKAGGATGSTAGDTTGKNAGTATGGITGGRKISVEIRTLNSKQLDLSIKMPAIFRAFEVEMRSAAAAILGRGKADVFVSVEGGECASAAVNGALFGEYYRQILAAAGAAGLPDEALAGVVPAILRMPDVLSAAESSQATEAEGVALLSAFGDALAALDRFRAAEGVVLLADILGRVSAIESLLAQVEPFEKARLEGVRTRILEHISSLGVTVDNNRLEQELIFWVEKLDVTEEKVRLRKHCDYFREVAAEPEAGRKLGFVAQEMGREINTLGSKANDAAMQRIVVRMKDELEKIKEQLLNIL